mgnify:CR=1 FL=1
MALKKPLVLNGGQIQRLQGDDYLEDTGLFDPTSNLGGINGLATNGLTVHNGTAFTTVYLTAPETGMTITNANGIGGNPTFEFTGALADILNVWEGILVKDNEGIVSSRTIQGTTDQIAVTNGAGTSGDPTIALASDPVIPGVQGVTVPAGTTGERGTGTNGMIRYNSDTNQFEFYQNGAWINYGQSNTFGTVTSVDVVLPETIFTASGGPITDSGTITFTLDDQAANTVFAAPNGLTGTPSFRSLVEADIPTLNWTKITSTPTTLSGYGITDAVSNSTQVIAGPGLTGGGALSSDVTISMPEVGTAVTSEFVKITTDAYGRVTGTDSIDSSDIIRTIGYMPLDRSGDSMEGDLDMTTHKITNLGAPTDAADAATKEYVDAVAQGLSVKPAVKVATTGNLTGTYDNGEAGVGATLNLGLMATLTIDGVDTWELQDGILVKDQTLAEQNGRYYVSQIGNNVDRDWILTRCGYCDEAHEIPSMFLFVQQGTVNSGTGWAAFVETADGHPTIFEVGIDNINFTQFSGAGAYTAGVGLSMAGSTFNVNLGAGIAELPGDEVGIDLYSGSANALILTTNGIDSSTAADAALFLKLDGSTLTQSASGLKVSSGGITATQLNTSVAGAGLAGGGGSALSVQVDGSTIDFSGNNLYVPNGGITATQLNASVAGAGLAGGGGAALSVNVDNSTIEINADTLRVKDGGITNAKLANSTISLAGDAGSGSVALGDTFTLLGGTGIDTSVSGSTTTVTLNASIDDLSDVTITTAASGHVLYHNGTAWVNAAPGATSGVQPYDSTLSALSGLSGTLGMIVETAEDTFVTREIVGTTGRITVTNGNGVLNNPTIDLASGVVTPGTYSSVTVDTYGRVVAGSAVETSTQVLLTNVNAGDIVKGTPVYVHSSGNVDKADAGAASTTRVIGLVADTSIATTTAGNIAVAGILSATTGQWDAITGQTGGLTAGAVYYLSDGTSGTLTTTAPVADGSYIAPVGIALSTTQMKIQIDPTIQL